MGKRSRITDVEEASTLKRRGRRDFPQELASNTIVVDEERKVGALLSSKQENNGPKQENNGGTLLLPKQENADCFFTNQLASTPIVEEKRGVRALPFPKEEEDSTYFYPGRYRPTSSPYGQEISDDDEDPSEDEDPNEEPHPIEEDPDDNEEDEDEDEKPQSIQDPDKDEDSDEDMFQGYSNRKEEEEDQKPTNSATPSLPAKILRHYTVGMASASASSSSSIDNSTSPKSNPLRRPTSTTLLNNTLDTIDPLLQFTGAYAVASATNPAFLPKKFNELTDEDLTQRLLIYGSAVADRLARCQTLNDCYQVEINHLREALVMKEEETQQLAMEKAELQKNLQIEEMLQQGTTSRVKDLEREVATLKVENSRLINRLESYKV